MTKCDEANGDHKFESKRMSKRLNKRTTEQKKTIDTEKIWIKARERAREKTPTLNSNIKVKYKSLCIYLHWNWNSFSFFVSHFTDVGYQLDLRAWFFCVRKTTFGFPIKNRVRC